MSTFVVMRLLESAPRRYDLGIRLLSLGRIDKLRDAMAQEVEAGDAVLDVGCGTGSLALLCAERGANVIGIDSSPGMLDIAREKLARTGPEDRVALKEVSAVDLDEAFSQASFDVVASSLVFSELSRDERRFVLAQCRRLLRDGGRLVIADEAVPRTWPSRLLSRIVRLPLVVLTYVLTQTTTRALADLGETIAEAGFAVRRVERDLLGGLQLVVAVKGEEE